LGREILQRRLVRYTTPIRHIGVFRVILIFHLLWGGWGGKALTSRTHLTEHAMPHKSNWRESTDETETKKKTRRHKEKRRQKEQTEEKT
jgi:hypothetical protein